MTLPDEETNRAMARLLQNQDFQTFLAWLKDEQEAGMADLLESTNPIIVHQRQGSSRALRDIQQTAMSAPAAVAAKAAARAM